MITVRPSRWPFRLIQRDRLPYLVPTRASQWRPLFQDSNRPLVDGVSNGRSDKLLARSDSFVACRAAVWYLPTWSAAQQAAAVVGASSSS